MKKVITPLGVLVVLYVLSYLPVSLMMGAYGETRIAGLGVERTWGLYTDRDHLLKRRRQKSLEVIFYPIYLIDRTLVHDPQRVGIEVDD